MLSATHALAGAVIGKNVDNVWLIILSAILTHYIFDSFRHGEYVESFNKKVTFGNTWWKWSLEFSVGFLIILIYLFLNKPSPIKTEHILIGSFFSILPDILTFIYMHNKNIILEKIYQFHAWVHPYPKYSPERKWNLRNEVNDIVFSVALIILLFFV